MAAPTAAPKPSRKRRKSTSPAPPTPAPDALQELNEILERLKNLDLPEEDGEPLESDYHVMQIPLLDELVRLHLGATYDYFCSGNMFIYYSVEQAVEVASYVRERCPREPRYKGPDFFLVKGVDGRKERTRWVVWEEGGRYPDLVIEIVSPSTAAKDKEANVEFYAQVFRVPEYFWYDPYTGELAGYRLVGDAYKRLEPNEHGWLWSEVLGAYVGIWEGEWRQRRRRWVRLYDASGALVLTESERAEQERQRAEQERQRAEAEAQRAEQERQRAEQERQRREQVEAELEQLRAKLREMGVEP